MAAKLQKAGLVTLLFHLLTDAEADEQSNVFGIGFLAERLLQVAE